MADARISQLTSDTPTTADALPIARSGANYKVTVQALANFLSAPTESPVTRAYVEVTVPAASVLTLFSVPYTLVEGTTDYVLYPEFLTIIKAAGTAYVLNGNTNIVLEWSNGTDVVSAGAASVLDQTTATFVSLRLGTNTLVSSATNPTVMSAGLRLTANVADMVTGSGDLSVGLVYAKVPKDMTTA